MKDKLVKEIKRNKFKLLSFLIGYLLIVIDYKMLEGIRILFAYTEMFYLIIFNLIFIIISGFSLKKILKIYKDIVIIKNDKSYIKIFKYLKILSLGALIGFISLVFQAFILVILPF
jgi:uncharacterized membrane-anchored protein